MAELLSSKGRLLTELGGNNWVLEMLGTLVFEADAIIDAGLTDKLLSVHMVIRGHVLRVTI